MLCLLIWSKCTFYHFKLALVGIHFWLSNVAQFQQKQLNLWSGLTIGLPYAFKSFHATSKLFDAFLFPLYHVYAHGRTIFSDDNFLFSLQGLLFYFYPLIFSNRQNLIFTDIRNCFSFSPF